MAYVVECLLSGSPTRVERPTAWQTLRLLDDLRIAQANIRSITSPHGALIGPAELRLVAERELDSRRSAA